MTGNSRLQSTQVQSQPQQQQGGIARRASAMLPALALVAAISSLSPLCALVDGPATGDLVTFQTLAIQLLPPGVCLLYECRFRVALCCTLQTKKQQGKHKSKVNLCAALISITLAMRSLEAVRVRAARFCNDRDWAQFHTPTNLALALHGEVGEVLEIVQWKGSLDENERVHMGEELSDVLIYTTRLCDRCSINLSNCVQEFMKGANHITNVRSSPGSGWDESISFELIANALTLEETNARFFCMKLAQQAGSLSALFSSHMECGVELEGWSDDEISDVGFTLASIVVLLATIAKCVGIDLADSISKKMDKNEAKYPISQSKGSSAKYTAYIKTKPNGVLGALLVGTLSLAVGVLLGRKLHTQKFLF